MRRSTRAGAMVLMLLLLSTFAQAQLPLYDLPEPFANPVVTSGSMAITRAGRFVAANAYGDSVSIIGLDRSLEAEITVGADPRGVTITPDNTQILAVSSAGRLTVIDIETGTVVTTYRVGEQAYHVLADDGLAYVSLLGEDAIAVLDLATGNVVARIATPPDPTALALWGDFLYVTHFWSGQFSLIYLPTREVVRTIQLHPDATLLQAIEIDPFSGRAFLPASQSNSRLPSADVGNRILPMLFIVDLGIMQVEEQINLVLADRNLSMPFAVAQPQNRSRLYIAHAGSNNVTVLNLDTGAADNHFEVGANPRAILFNSQSTRVITHNVVDQTLSIVGTGFLDIEDSPPTTAMPFSAQQQIGQPLFHNARAPRLSSNGLLNCAACHFDRLSDGRAWNGEMTPVLADLPVLGAEALNVHIAALMGGAGFEPDSIDIAALLEYLRQ